MAPRLAPIVTAGLAVLALIISAGCGVKAPPIPSTKVAPAQIKDLVARPLAEGMEVSFNLPKPEKADRQIDEVRLYYGYLPLTGVPGCPPCPPKLRKYKSFDLSGEHQVKKGGRFVYLDKDAPMGQEAIYQVELIDARMRTGVRSNLARAPRVSIPEAPQGVKAAPADGKVNLTWQGPAGEEAKARTDYFAGYRVFRQGPDGAKTLTTRPVTKPAIVDKTVTNNEEYIYRVAALRSVKGVLVEGAKSPGVKVRPGDITKPRPASGLMGASGKEGIYLRFTPSPDVDTKGYLVMRKDKKGAEWLQVNPDLLTENTFLDTGVKANQTYIYSVIAVDEAGNKSDMSKEIKIFHQP